MVFLMSSSGHGMTADQFYQLLNLRINVNVPENGVLGT